MTLKYPILTWHWWLMPAILLACDADMRMIIFESQPRQIVLPTFSQKTKNG
jgi:hypothetical protein